jgi:hypothetical protein
MERAEDGLITWKKVGGGSLRLNGRMIKPGQIFKARPEEIPVAFKDLIIPLEQVRLKDEPVIVAAKLVYELKPRGKSKSLFDVVDKNGKVLNEKALTKEVAQNLIDDLER